MSAEAIESPEDGTARIVTADTTAHASSQRYNKDKKKRKRGKSKKKEGQVTKTT